MNNRRKWMTVIGIAAAFGIMVTGCSQGGTSERNLSGSSEKNQVNNSSDKSDTALALKSFQADTLDGGSFTQEDLAKKDVTVINFWGVQCGPCIMEMPDIADFAKSLPEHVQVITVCLDGERDIEGAKSILKDAGYEGTTLLGGDGDFERLCGEIMYTPTTIAVDQDGNIIGDAVIGAQQDVEHTYLEMINNALSSMGKAEISHEEN